MHRGDPKLRYVYTAWAFLECLGFGGLLYGWGSLVYVLKDEGLYLDLCDEPSNSSVVKIASKNDTSGYAVNDDKHAVKSCSERDSRLALVFTIGSAMFCVCCFCMGQINFKFGTRITRLAAAVMFISGSLMTAFTSNDIPWLIFPGLSLLGGGGITYLMTNAQISLLFTTGGSAVVGLFCGGFDASSGIQLMMKFGHENGISRFTSFIILSCAHLLTLISTFFFMPKDYIQKPGMVKKQKETNIVTEETGEELISASRKSEDKEDNSSEEIPSLRSCMLTPTYILHVAWLAILQLRFYFLLGSINPTLVMRLDDDAEEVSHYTNVLMYILMCGLVTSPLAGMVYDFHTKMFKDSRSEFRRTVMPAVLPQAITTLLCMLMSAVILIKTPEALYIVFFLLLLFRSFLYTLAAGYISNIFPSQYFGMMYGVLILVGGIVSFFQYIFFEWAEATSFEQVNIFLLILMSITFIQPLYQWRASRKAEVNIFLLILMSITFIQPLYQWRASRKAEASIIHD